MLKSEDILSTDEESSGGESDDELETLLRGNKTSSQLTREQEEAERLELKKLIMGEKKETVTERGGCACTVHTAVQTVSYLCFFLDGSVVHCVFAILKACKESLIHHEIIINIII